MASRMDRYKEDESRITGRSDRNKSLYKQIEDLDSYTNIAGVATIDNKNSIDLEKVKELLRHSEKKEEIILDEETIEEKELEETRKYDIKDLLSKAKDNDNEESKYRSLSKEHYKLLEELNKRNQQNKKMKEMEVVELEELVKTISDMEPVDENSIDGDDVGLLDDLKSDTMVGDAASIKKIIEEEKEFTKELDTMKLDNSFYTSSFSFTKRDFEELKDINHKIKKGNKFIIALLILIIILIVVASVYYIMK